MNFRARIASLAAVAAVAIFTLGGCAQTPNRFYSVILSPSGTIYVAQASSTTITATVLNDAANGGVTFSLSPAGTGTLTQTGPITATYVAPANVSAATTVVVSAQSVDYPKSSSILTINVEPPPTITTTTLPSGSIGAAYSGQVVATGGVPPLAWSISSGNLPAGLGLANSTNDTVNITGKPTSNGPSSFTSRSPTLSAKPLPHRSRSSSARSRSPPRRRCPTVRSLRRRRPTANSSQRAVDNRRTPGRSPPVPRSLRGSASVRPVFSPARPQCRARSLSASPSQTANRLPPT